MNKIEFIDLKTQYEEIRDQVSERMQRVLDHGRYIMGPEVVELEEQLCKYTEAKNCITVSSGTEALLIALMALGVKPGDEVITTPFTFVATAEVIVLLGAVPVFVDIERDTGNMDANLLEAAITPRTKAIIPVSLYGQTCDMAAICNIASARGNIPVIEDAAQSFGSTFEGKKSCNLSLIACTSFFPSKPLGCYGDGGALFTDDLDLATAMREIRVHGQQRRYHHARIGVGGRMDTLQCAVVLAKLERFDWEVEMRMLAGQRYIDLLAGCNSVVSPVVRNGRTSVWAQFTIQVDNREEIIAKLGANDIPTAVHYPVPLHRQPAYEKCCRISGELTNAEYLSKRVMSLPMHPYLDQDAQERIVSML